MEKCTEAEERYAALERIKSRIHQQLLKEHEINNRILEYAEQQFNEHKKTI